MKHRPYYPPKGITREDVARAYEAAGSMEGAAGMLGCSSRNVGHHLHRSGAKVRRWDGAFKHVRSPNGGIMRVSLRPDEEPKDTVLAPTRKILQQDP